MKKFTLLFILVLAFLTSCCDKSKSITDDKFVEGKVVIRAYGGFTTGVIQVPINPQNKENQDLRGVIYKKGSTPTSIYDKVWFTIEEQAGIQYATKLTTTEPGAANMYDKSLLKDRLKMDLHVENYANNASHNKLHILSTGGGLANLGGNNYYNVEVKNTDRNSLPIGSAFTIVVEDTTNLQVATNYWIEIIDRINGTNIYKFTNTHNHKF